MIPFRFGQSDQQMFAIYQRPVAADDCGEAILICNPFGQEAIRTHRLLKLLADRLVRNGLHVMRFDYRGTGDSDGEDSEIEFEGFLADTLAAHRELLDKSGVSVISWFGFRLGASVAALASSSAVEVPRRLVLWEPIFDGRQYLRELDEAHLAALKRDYGARWVLDAPLRQRFEAEAGKEALGFTLSATLRESISALMPDNFSKATALEVTMFCEYEENKPRAIDEQVSQAILQRRRSVAMNPASGGIVWTANEMMNASVAPPDVMAAIAASFGEAA